MTIKTWVQCRETGKLIPKGDHKPVRATAIFGDITPHQNMHTGEWVTSRSRHREILREHNLVEVGDQYIPAATIPSQDTSEIEAVLRHYCDANGIY